jgi:hypothetical protein
MKKWKGLVGAPTMSELKLKELTFNNPPGNPDVIENEEAVDLPAVQEIVADNNHPGNLDEIANEEAVDQPGVEEIVAEALNQQPQLTTKTSNKRKKKPAKTTAKKVTKKAAKKAVSVVKKGNRKSTRLQKVTTDAPDKH